MDRRISNEFYSGDTCIKVYDPNKKKVIGVYPNLAKASTKMLIPPKVILNKTVSKKRIYSKLYNMEVAIRECFRKEGDLLLIEKTLKNLEL